MTPDKRDADPTDPGLPSDARDDSNPKTHVVVELYPWYPTPETAAQASALPPLAPTRDPKPPRK
jgi:hypothetical protein